jgi:hypothetical protein
VEKRFILAGMFATFVGKPAGGFSLKLMHFHAVSTCPDEELSKDMQRSVTEKRKPH